MTNNFYGGFSPYQQQYQQLQQRLQTMTQPQVVPQQPVQEDKILSVSSEEVARNTNIPLDGSTTYFKYGNSILARRWNISEGRVCSSVYEIQQEDETVKVVEKSADRLKAIEDTLQEILKKVTYPINKKVDKSDKGAEKDDK